MGDRFRVILRGKKLYKEVELLPEMKNFRVGTSTECEVRLRKELFFESVELTFVRNENDWAVLCASNLFLSAGDSRKLLSIRLEHGTVFSVCYQKSGSELFTVEFLIDFENESKKLSRKIDVSNLQYFGIGVGGQNQIVLQSRYLKNDEISCIQSGNALTLAIRNTTYGVYINGRKAKDGAVVRSGDFFSLSDAVFYYRDGFLWTEESDLIQTNQLPVYSETRGTNYPRFNRNTRIKAVLSEDKIEILDPPQKPEKPKANLFQRLFPSLGMLIAAGVMAYMGGVTMLIFSGISGLMAIITAIVSIIQGNKDFKKKSADRIEKYEAYIEGKKKEISQARDTERRILEEIYCSDREIGNRMSSFSCDLFDRDCNDDDFLCVRLGTGAVEAKRKIEYKKQEKLEIEDDLQKKPEEIGEEYRYVEGAPVVCDLKSINAVGVVGPEDACWAMMDRMILDIVARHYYTDVRLIFIASPEHKENIWQFRMLPYVYNDALKIRNIVCNESSKNLVFEYLYKELVNREQSKSFDNHLIVFVLDDNGLKTHPISRFIGRAKDLGVTFVFFAQSRADTAQGCGYLINMEDSCKGTLVSSSNRSEETPFNCSVIGKDAISSMVSLMAPVYTEEISLESSLTKNITLFQLLNILAVDDLDLDKRWSESKVFKSMAAPLGVSKTGTVYLDLHDHYHGPHGLVAGTTGSGKSELLQSYVLSMATLFHPHEVGFVIIDFKGGGMANQFRDLPHLMGSITNIDGREINRSLKSIKAELQKRQRLFADADVNHIDKYIQKYKTGEVKEALPHLIIIVDEFAELKAEQPEFMKELISAARIGRSLGVHLILATQKPAGQVNEQIWSNSRFKLCLKVQGPEDSNEVLKSPLAAEIKEPGRAYLQVGNNEVFELFQSAYSGAPEHADDMSVKEFTVYEMADSGRKIPVYQQKRQKKEGGKIVTQLDAIVEYINHYCNDSGIRKLQDICLPSLERVIEYEENEIDEYTVPIGLYDDPDNQYQGVWGINLFTDNTLVIGASMTGKTNLLQLVIKKVAEHYSPKEVTIYVIDFASMVLKSFEKLNHIGGVVIPTEEEKMMNLFKLLSEEIQFRRKKLLSAGVGNFLAYKEAGFDDLPQIVLIVDNILSLRELSFVEEDLLLPICRNGLSVGISVVISSPQTSGIGYKYYSCVNRRIAFFCNDQTEYNSLFDHCRMQLENIPGRCLIQLDKTIYEAQTYISFGLGKEYERAQAIEDFIEKINQTYASRAKQIPVVPSILIEDNLLSDFGAKSDTNKLLIGVDFSNVEPASIEFVKQNVLFVSGSLENSKAQFLTYLKKALSQMDVEISVLDDYNELFGDISDSKTVSLYSKRIEDITEMLTDLRDTLAERYAKREMFGMSAVKDFAPIVLFVNSYEAVKYISNDRKALDVYTDIVKKYKNLKSLIIFSNIENEAISFNSPELLRMMKEDYQVMMFENLKDVKLFDVPMAISRAYKNPLKQNEAYFVSGSAFRKVKTVTTL